MKNIYSFFRGCLFAWAIGSSFLAKAQISVTYPVSRMVIQRNNANQAALYMSGKIAQSVDRVQARLLKRTGEGGTAVDWQTIQTNPENGVFYGFIQATGGRYDLEIRGMKGQNQVGSVARVEKVGIGEVFLIVGHSNAQGGDGYSPSIPYEESNTVYQDQVNSIDFRESSPTYIPYWYETASPDDLPALVPSQLCLECGMAPGAPRWFWGRMGEALVQKLNVPVLFYNAAFGGTNIEMTYKAAYDIPFDHGFVRYSLRHPYVNIRNVLKKYAPQSGIRGILSGHGSNDRLNVGKDFEDQYIKVIEKTRQELGYQSLAWLVAQDCWSAGRCYGKYEQSDANNTEHITKAQLNLVAKVSDVFAGADLNTIESDGRMDIIHFNQTGQKKAAAAWVKAITEPQNNISFLSKSQPMIAKTPAPVTANPTAVTSVKTGAWSDPSTWNCNCVPNYSTEVTIQAAHEVTIKGVFFAKKLVNRGKLTYQTN
ncbi:hypothetical protein BWI96_06605 [Siphonobacter sp. SORGH_AS_0500]|nr:hypothetical protein BWI96_06605 [Siphonobacter sp. SORGH_AS_0500]